jgi:hypothetical protein
MRLGRIERHPHARPQRVIDVESRAAEIMRGHRATLARGLADLKQPNPDQQ